MFITRGRDSVVCGALFLMHLFKVTETARLKTLICNCKDQSDSVQLQLPKMYA